MPPQNFLPYSCQTISQDDIDAVTDVLQGDMLTTGPKVSAFEVALSEKTGAQEAIVCGNGTQALHLALMAAGIGEDDHVIVPTITFLATANAVRYCGAEVIFADVDSDTGLLTPATLQQALDNNPDKTIRAVMPVHLGGHTVDMTAIREIADTHDLTIIADSCHALGGTYHGYTVGSCTYADFATFSFHPVKAIAMGEGGAVTTNNTEVAEKMRRLRSHGMQPRPDLGPWVYDMAELGYNYRASDIQCALGLSQLNKLDDFINKRRELAEYYDELLAPLHSVVKSPQRVEGCEPAWHLYAVRIDFEAAGITRGEVMTQLKEQGIGTQVHYIPVHTQPYYEDRYGHHDLPGATRYYNSTLSLPLYPSLETGNVEHIIQCLSQILQLP